MNDLRSSSESIRQNLKNKIVEHLQKARASTDTKPQEEAIFETLALEVFDYQYKFNAFYREYCTLIGKEFSAVSHLHDVPFLPIQFFKTQIIKSGDWATETIFTSSGTTGSIASQHHVRDLDFYKAISRQGFEKNYGNVDDYCLLGLLPAYLDRSGSSLITMVEDFIQRSKYPESGFFLNDHTKLASILRGCFDRKIPTILIGVSFALLDFVENQTLGYSFPESIVMETGGMKGRRRELVRSELHDLLAKGFNVPHIHSEYGMTELFSQAYAKQNGIFACTPTMRVVSRELNDPLSITSRTEELGALNIIDLANLDSCSFIATDDLGRVNGNTFTVLGRLDNSDVRGCNLMVAEQLI